MHNFFFLILEFRHVFIIESILIKNLIDIQQCKDFLHHQLIITTDIFKRFDFYFKHLKVIQMDDCDALTM